MAEDGNTGDRLVSVILPSYDRPDMLREAALSVDAQTYRNMELIVVDDASPTPAEQRIDELSLGVPYRVLRHDENRGANHARNTGIAAATGDIMAFLDDDDRWTPSTVSAYVGAFRSGPPHLGVVLVGQRYVRPDGSTVGVKRPEIDGPATARLYGGAIAGPFSTIAVRADLIARAGLPDARLPCWQDREWLIRLSKQGTFTSIRDPLVLRRMGTYGQIGDRFVERRDRAYDLLLNKHGADAAAYGLAGSFEAGLARGVTMSALRSNEYGEARRYAARAVLKDPTSFLGYAYAFAALGGDITYRSARRVKRTMDRAVAG